MGRDPGSVPQRVLEHILNSTIVMTSATRQDDNLSAEMSRRLLCPALPKDVDRDLSEETKLENLQFVKFLTSLRFTEGYFGRFAFL